MKQGLPKVAGESGVPIRNYYLGQPMMLEDFREKDLGNLRCRGGGMHWTEVSSFGEPINEYNYGVMSFLGERQLNYEVHGNLFPSVDRCWQGLKQSGRLLVARFVSLACITC